jgi:hypothetical protein
MAGSTTFWITWITVAAIPVWGAFLVVLVLWLLERRGRAPGRRQICPDERSMS